MQTFRIPIATVSCLSAAVALGLLQEAKVLAQNPAPAAGDSSLEEIVVTGSRIQRRDFTSQSPI